MIQNIFLLALIAPIIAFIVVKAYDKFEKKDYPTKTYIQVTSLSYIVSVAVLYLTKMFNCGGNKCPWKETTNVFNGVKPNISTPPVVTKVVPTIPVNNPSTKSTGLFEKVINKISQSGGSNQTNLLANNTGEVFHTGTPTF